MILSYGPPLFAQGSFFPFRIDQDALSGAPDFSFLNHPLAPEDRLIVRAGHFCRMGYRATADDNPTPKIAGPNTVNTRTTACDRVRLFGANLAFGANFPTADDASRIARRLRKLGINLVRLHHMDSSPDSNPSNAGSILTTGPYPTLNSVAISRLRTFLDALKAEGIYVDLNLHVGYTFRPEVDKVPRVSDLLAMPNQSKPLHIFYPRMVQLQGEFALKLIEALALRDDPVLGLVEIDNETSLLQAWQTGGLDKYLLGDYRGEFQWQWNQFLREKYASTEALGSAWGSGEASGPELLSKDAKQWRLEVLSPAQAGLEVVRGDPPTIRITVHRGGAPVILKQVAISTAADRPYLAEVEIRADLPDGASRSVYWDIQEDINPRRILRGKTIAVTNQWQKFAMAVTSPVATDGTGRFALSVEDIQFPIYVRNWSFGLAPRWGLKGGETIGDANVGLVGEEEAPTLARANDYLLFLSNRDANYLRTVLGAVRSAAGNLVPVGGTQMGYGGLLNLDSHAELDFQDNHFYVDHYNFPHAPWDGRDWRIRDSSAVGSGLGAFLNMAAARQAGKPYTVSEFNEPWPNTHGSEIDVALAAFGAFQDWDSIMHFAYSHSRNWDDGVPNGFNIHGDWTKFPNFGQAAWLFRSGAIQNGRQPLEIPISQDLRLQAGREKANGNISTFLATHVGCDSAVAFLHPLSVRRVQDHEAFRPHADDFPPAVLSSPFDSDNGELVYDRERKRFLILATQATGVIGFVGTDTASLTSMDVKLGPSARGFASILLTALDGQALGKSRHLLLSTPGYTLRTEPQVAPPRPQALLNYPGTTDWWTLEPDLTSPGKPSGNLNSGLIPVWMERVESYLTFRTDATRLIVYPLDGAGSRLDPLASGDVEPIADGFRIHLQGANQKLSPWYELVANR